MRTNRRPLKSARPVERKPIMYDAYFATACTAFGIGLWVGYAITAAKARR